MFDLNCAMATFKSGRSKTTTAAISAVMTTNGIAAMTFAFDASVTFVDETLVEFTSKQNSE